MQTRTGHIYEPCHKRARLIHDPITNIQLANAVRTMHEPIANYNHLPTTKRTIQEIITNIPLTTTKIIRNDDPSVNKSCSSMLLDCLPLDILISIFTCLSSTASSPLHIIGPRQTCKKFKALASHPLVLAKASLPCLHVKPSVWCDASHRYLQQCAEAGNMEACYTLGMIQFYCLGEREQGMMLMGRAARACHMSALYSLGVIYFNGSGRGKSHKNLRAGAWLCARSASLGHLDAMRELGHCLQDGYGVSCNIIEGRKLLVHANAREAIMTNSTVSSRSSQLFKLLQIQGWSHFCHSGCNLSLPDVPHLSNQFLVDWFTLLPPPINAGLRLCSNHLCGRIETRRHEFRRCSDCGCVNYCSRACQARDWKLRHKFACHVIPQPPPEPPHYHHHHLHPQSPNHTDD